MYMCMHMHNMCMHMRNMHMHTFMFMYVHVVASATHQHVPLTPTILPLVAMARTCFSTCARSKYVVSK